MNNSTRAIDQDILKYATDTTCTFYGVRGQDKKGAEREIRKAIESLCRFMLPILQKSDTIQDLKP